jgi:N-carbamoylputrescine amidase
MTVSSKSIRVGLVQQASGSSRDANLAASTAGIREAAAGGAALVLLQELHTTPYFCQTEDPACFDLAEPVPGPSTQQFGALAAELGIVIVISLFEKRAEGLYHNTAVVLDADGSIAGRYRKMHIPDDPGYYEKYYFAPGDLGFEPIDTSVGRLGVLICWDQWYPEAARLTALAGADILVYPTAIGWHPEEKESVGDQQHAAWQTVQRGHAVANGSYVISVNRTGFESGPDGGGIEFWGKSFAAGPGGELLTEADAAQPQTLIFDLDIDRVEQTRVHWPFFRDRRVDAYADITRRYIDAQ